MCVDSDTQIASHSDLLTFLPEVVTLDTQIWVKFDEREKAAKLFISVDGFADTGVDQS